MTAAPDAGQLRTSTDVVAATERRRRNPLTRRLPWWGEALIAVVFYWLYDAVQALTQSDIDEARQSVRSERSREFEAC